MHSFARMCSLLSIALTANWAAAQEQQSSSRETIAAHAEEASGVEPESALHIELRLDQRETVPFGTIDFVVVFENRGLVAFPLDTGIRFGSAGNLVARLVVRTPSGAEIFTQISQGNYECYLGRKQPMLEPGERFEVASTLSWVYRENGSRTSFREAALFDEVGTYRVAIRCRTHSNLRLESNWRAITIRAPSEATQRQLELLRRLSAPQAFYEPWYGVVGESDARLLDELLVKRNHGALTDHARIALASRYAVATLNCRERTADLDDVARAEAFIARAKQLVAEVPERGSACARARWIVNGQMWHYERPVLMQKWALGGR